MVMVAMVLSGNFVKHFDDFYVPTAEQPEASLIACRSRPLVQWRGENGRHPQHVLPTEQSTADLHLSNFYLIMGQILAHLQPIYFAWCLLLSKP